VSWFLAACLFFDTARNVVACDYITMSLEVHPPLPAMEALSVDSVLEGKEWQSEPKWDGFRCLAFRDRDKIELQSKSQQPLAR
jgi:ATP-dependent DNA ligase